MLSGEKYDGKTNRVFVVFNASSGSSDREKFFWLLNQRFTKPQWEFEIFEILKEENEEEEKQKHSFHLFHRHKKESDSDGDQLKFQIWRETGTLALKGDINKQIEQQEELEKRKYSLDQETYLDKALLKELKRVCEAINPAYDFVFVGGGDGTVSWVVNGMVGSKIPIVIIPSGTGNAIAQELGLPRADLDEILTFYSRCLDSYVTDWHPIGGSRTNQTITRELPRRQFDLIKVGDNYFALHVDVGLGATTVQQAQSSEKRLLGVPAYLLSLARTAWNHKPATFKITVDVPDDGQSFEHVEEIDIVAENKSTSHNSEKKERGKGVYKVVASEVVLCNSSVIGINPGITWGDGIKPDDGVLNIAVFLLENTGHYVNVMKDIVVNGNPHYNDKVVFITAKKTVKVEVLDMEEDKPDSIRELPAQGDGDLFGKTPIYAEFVPGSCVFVAGHLGGGYVSSQTVKDIVKETLEDPQHQSIGEHRHFDKVVEVELPKPTQ